MRTSHAPVDGLPTRARRSARPRRDAGTTLVEIVITIVLLSLGVVAMLTTLNVTILATATERDHANAHAWLQSASDLLYGHERMDCDQHSLSTIESTYQSVIDGSDDPEGWHASGGSIQIVSPVLFWDGTNYQSTCFDDFTALQLITIRVADPNGKIVETVQVVKG